MFSDWIQGRQPASRQARDGLVKPGRKRLVWVKTGRQAGKSGEGKQAGWSGTRAGSLAGRPAGPMEEKANRLADVSGKAAGR